MDARQILLVGWRGGVGHAVLRLLARHPAAAPLLGNVAKIWLLDRERAVPDHALPVETACLPAQELRTTTDLSRVLERQRVDTVIELAQVGTMDCVRVCDALGIDYLSTSFERWGEEPGHHSMLEVRNILPGHRPSSARSSHLVGSGMNPGIVNALALRGIELFARRVGVRPEALDLHALLITEEDTTTASLVADGFACTWSPRGCLSELFEPSATYVGDGVVRTLDHASTEATYEVRCGSDLVAGYVVPHEEVVTLGARLPKLEVAFVYRLPPKAREFLRRHPGLDPRTCPVARLYPPAARPTFEGVDRVGVLLCSRRYGELWIGYETSAAQAERFDTNATQLQVAAGVLAGWDQLGCQRGVHTVEELDAGRYLERVQTVLGPPTVVHDPHAPVRSLRERRLGADAGVAASIAWPPPTAPTGKVQSR